MIVAANFAGGADKRRRCIKKKEGGRVQVRTRVSKFSFNLLRENFVQPTKCDRKRSFLKNDCFHKQKLKPIVVIKNNRFKNDRFTFFESSKRVVLSQKESFLENKTKKKR